MMTLAEALQRGAATPTAHVASPRRVPPVTVHVFSDPACPWCHIGAKRLQRAVRQYKRRYGQAAPLQLAWNPLLVDSDVSAAGEEVESYAARRWGLQSSAEWRARLSRSGLPEGAAFADWRTVPNTLLAAELVAIATDQGLADQAVDLLFTRTYEEGANISLLGELLDIGEALGMQRHELRRELTRSDSQVRAAVMERDAAAKQRLKINAIPHYIVCAGPNSRTKYSLNGAHQTSDLLGAMERVAKEELQAAGRDAAAVARAAGGQPAYGAALLKAAAGKPAGSNALFC
ncbi:hypothetical protein CHLRE_10g464500v5 [Chlamydomonas reinhardtii]|uniref:DSBA-like thioredoxin domain-containing protein n=1 Tax=Chlamydomonas reinhardtii TaxID=3055 RepID=A8I1J2_CHLRE|nr:uncharacterized protein CHLRE_10g464500v5 [Chlamydomonas reinhardtii]PNW78108.1 hypothetical protein CHLRE_10g464500v5 [Chlamydomonas reinhardtii]|eukprot:XP_001698439.1 predicted protein [Chlamydomonas reinhardtii]